MTNQLFKNGVLPFVVDAYDQSVYDSKIVFSTQDIGTAKLVFQMRKDGVPLPLSAVDGKLVLKFANGSKHIRNITLVDKVEGIAEYILDSNEIKIFGKVQASLNLYYRNGQSLSVHEFTFEIDRNLIDRDIAPAAEFYIDDFQSLKKQIERMAAELETDIQNRTEDMQGNIDKITKELQEQLDRMKEKLDDLEALETKQGAQDKVNAHANNSEIHVVKADKDKWNNGQLYRLTQNNGKPIYKGTSETTDYNEITDTGFYLIYNKGLNGPPSINASFMIVISYTSTLLQTIYDTTGRKSYYRIKKTDSTWSEWTRVLTEEDKITQSEKDKWNNGQLFKLTPDDGKVARLTNGTDIFTLPTGFYMGANLVNTPISNDGSFYYVEVLETAYSQDDVNYKRIIVTRSFDNMTWIGTFHAQGFRGWKKTLTVEDVANSTFVDTYDQDNSSVSAAENVATKLVFGATRADDLSEYNRTRAEITLKNSGLYLIRLYVTSTNITVGSDNILACYVNGTEFQRLGNWNPTTASSTCVLYLSQKFKAGDKVTFYITPKGTGKTIAINTAYVTMSQVR
ncbi:BppU family phage baseplate upper protein [Bacillus safensis]